MDTIGAFIDPGMASVRARRDRDLAKIAEKGQLRKKQSEDKQRENQKSLKECESQDMPAPRVQSEHIPSSSSKPRARHNPARARHNPAHAAAFVPGGDVDPLEAVRPLDGARPSAVWRDRSECVPCTAGHRG